MPEGRYRTLLLVIAAGAVSPVRAAADLSVGKSAAPDPVVVNRPIRYQLTVTNRGPDDANDVRIEDVMSFDSASVEWQTPADTSCAFSAPRTLSCRLDRLPAGQSRALEITATAPALTGTVRNSAEVSAASPDPDAGNNVATAAVTVVPFSASADLELTAAAGPNPVREGGTLTYRLTVRNLGPAEAPGTSLTHAVTPLALADLLSTESSQGQCRTVPTSCIGIACGDPVAAPLEVRCALETLAPGGGATVTLRVRATSDAGRTLTGVAEAASDRADPEEASNRSVVSTRVGSFLDERTSVACVTSLVAGGTSLEAFLPALRAFRDRLKRHRLGVWLVRGYYRASPPVGRWLLRRPQLIPPLRAALRLTVGLLGYIRR